MDTDGELEPGFAQDVLDVIAVVTAIGTADTQVIEDISPSRFTKATLTSWIEYFDTQVQDKDFGDAMAHTLTALHDWQRLATAAIAMLSYQARTEGPEFLQGIAAGMASDIDNA